MKINVGSKNEVKITAVKEVIEDYPILKNSEVISVEVQTEVSDHPKSLNETIKGAVSRAKNAFQNCNYSFGIESGLMEVPFSKSGFMDVCACAIFDGKEIHIGLSSVFEFPKQIMKLILENNLNASDAFHKAGLVKDNKLGSREGAIGFLTKGRVKRKDQAKQAILSALIYLENKGLY